MAASLKDNWFVDLLHLVYPNTCAACGKRLQKQEDILCLFCEYDLPKTDYHLEPDNRIAKHFWGRVNLENVAALYFFSKGSRVQRMIHQLKYRGNTDIGIKAGQIYGDILKETPNFGSAEVIIPVPLHPKKKKRRGFNQSDYFAEGLSESMGIPWYADAVIRNVFTDTQTKKNRFNRWKNVESIFTVSNPELLENRHILLVDDVITTGSTIEACANELLNLAGTKVSVVSIACAHHL